MGNNQSTAHNRLSKPKTNTNSPIAAAKVPAESQASINSRYASLSVQSRQQIKDALLSPVESNCGDVAFPLPAKEDVVAEPAVQPRGRTVSIASKSNSRTNSRANSRSNSFSFFGSRHGSAAKLGANDSKVSLISTGQMDVEAAIRLLQEVKKNASPEELVALHEALEPVDEVAAPVTEQNLSHENSLMNRSSSSLTRRRSLIQTPGVATRISPVEGRRRTWNSWRAPQLNPEEEEKWKTTPKRAPTTQLSVPSVASEGRSSSVPRARTPSELDYSHLGSLKLGTLKVTNGEPSPSYSVKLTKQQPLQRLEEDYFSPLEVADSPLTMKTTRRRAHTRSKSVGPPTTVQLIDSDIPLPTIKPRYYSVQASVVPQEVPQPEPKSEVVIKNDGIPQTQNAHQFAQSYQSEIPMSPFDNLPSSLQAGYNARVTMHELDASGESLPTALTAPIPCEVTEPQHPKGPRPLPQTADSGYSSGGSFRIDHQDYLAISSRRSVSPEEETASLTSGPAELHAHSISYESTQPAIVQVAQAQRRPSALKMFEHPARSSGVSSLSDGTMSPQTPSSIGSKHSFDSTSSTQKRLRKRRPSQPEAPVVQVCQSIPEGTIPDIPNSVRMNFNRRLSNTPGMECLEHTYLSKDHEQSPECDAKVTPPVAVPQQFTELEPQRPSIPPAQSRRRSLSLFRRKSYADDRSNTKAEEIHFDLGTIATSLGTSPYDAAMAGSGRKMVTAPTHPHQLGNSLPRAKSMVMMDSEVAAEFARMRSKDRAIMNSQLPQHRSRSSHNLKSEVGEARAMRRRPQSFAQDIPPVPVIDASKHKGSPTAIVRPQCEGQRRPRSEMEPKVQQLRQRSRTMSQAVNENKQSGTEPAQLDQNGLSWEAHSLSWSRRRKSIGEGLRAKNGMAEASASSVNSRTASRSPQDVESWGRFSGGLQYNYQGGGFIAGSAGTQAAAHNMGNAKSMQWKMQHGVDLSDVPIMLQRA